MSLEIALEKIRREAKEKTGFLDIGNLGLDEIPEELFALAHLKTLILNRSRDFFVFRFDPQSNERIYSHTENCKPNKFKADDKRLSKLCCLETFISLGAKFSDLSIISELEWLTTLDVSYTEVKDLSPLSKLQLLATVDISNTEVKDLTPLSKLQSLDTLRCWSNKVIDLTPLSKLQSLATLDISYTKVKDLTPLSKLQSLAILQLYNTKVEDLTPLSKLQSLSTINISNTDVKDLTPLSMLQSLATLDISFTKVKDLTPLSKLHSLDTLRCWSNKVIDLTPLSNLLSLASIDISNTDVKDLTPLSNLQSLATLFLSYTKVEDLTPLSKLQSLDTLEISNTEVKDLTPLSKLQALTTLYLSNTKVKDLTPLSNLWSLAILMCWDNRIIDLTPLSNLHSLATIEISNTQVTDLTPLSNLRSLATIDISDTEVTDLSPLSKLQSLTSLNISNCEVTDLTPLSNLPSISILDAFDCPISKIWEANALAKLNELILGSEKSLLGEIPPEVLSQDEDDNCIHRLRDHFADLGEHPSSFDEVKIFLLGNGRIGKTQIARQLLSKGYDASELSTHGVKINSANFTLHAGVVAKLNIWDFGGQDIYHGTHALFLKSRAVFVVVWTPESEQGESSDPDGTTYANEPLSYWIDYVEKLGGARSPLIVLQNQCDENREPIASEKINVSESCRNFLNQVGISDDLKRQISFCGVSAKDRSHWDKFETELKNSIHSLWSHSHPKIGKKRFNLWNELEARRSDGTTKRLSWPDYIKRVEHYGITGAEGFAEILHNAGMVFWKKELFGGDLILRQDWCLDAIYTVLTRQSVLQKVQSQNGIFTQKDLNAWVWSEAGHSDAEQRQFLDMMKSCGICFSVGGHGAQEEFIAPELLIPPSDNQARNFWKLIPGKIEEVEFRLPFLAPGTSRAVLAELGKYAKRNATYWKYGLFFWGTCGTAVMVEEKIDTRSHTRGGSIILRTKGSAHASIRSHLATLIQEVLEKLSPQPTISETSPWERKKFDKVDERNFEALPPRTELEWNSERVLHAMRPSKQEHVFVLGSFDRRITFHSQQVRALRLIRALHESGLLAGKAVAVVGGGVAGITTAVAAAKAGAESVSVFEERSQILQLQARASHRFIHPHIYEWPAEGSESEDAGLPIMNWAANNADKVVLELHTELEKTGYVNIDEKLSQIKIKTETCVESFRERHGKVELYLKNCFCPEEFDLMIITSGFGLDAERVLDTPGHPYWEPDNLEGPFSSENKERILVSGTGDGGLIDLVRATIHTGNTTYGPHCFQHSEAVKKLCQEEQFHNLGEQLEKVDQRYRMAEQSKAASYDLRKHYHAVFRELEGKKAIIDAVNGMKRKDTDVWFNYARVDDVFNLNSALLNRVLVLLIIECGIIHPLRGRIEKCVKEQDLYAVKMCNKEKFETQRFNRVIFRFGPDKEYLPKRFAELGISAEELRNKGLLFPVTKLDQATKDFFAKL